MVYPVPPDVLSDPRLLEIFDKCTEVHVDFHNIAQEQLLAPEWLGMGSCSFSPSLVNFYKMTCVYWITTIMTHGININAILQRHQ